MSEIRYDLSAIPTPGSWSRPSAKKQGEDQLFYGWRYRPVAEEDGGDGRFERVPRTRADFLNPQEGDEMGQDSLHLTLTLIFYTLFRRRYPVGGKMAVFADLLTRFAGKNLKNASPDIFLVEGGEDPERRRRSFQEIKEAGKICLAVEIVSPDYAFKDYEHNPQLYERAGIREYLIVHPLGDYLNGPYKLSGYRLDQATGKYKPILPDSKGRLYSATTDLFLSADPKGWGLAVVDATTGQRVLTDDEALAAAKRRASEAKREASEAEHRANEAEREASEAKREASEAKREASEAKREASEAERRANEAERQVIEAKRQAEEEARAAEAENRRLKEQIARIEGHH